MHVILPPTANVPSAPAWSRSMPVMILLSVAVLALFTVTVSIHASVYGTPVPLALPLAAMLCGAPLLALFVPRTAIGLFCAAAVLLPLLGLGGRDASWPWPWSVPMMIAFALFLLLVTLLHGWRTGALPWAVGNLAALITAALLTDAATTGPAGVVLIVNASISSGVLLIAALIGGSLRVSEELSREREVSTTEHARRLVMEERTRIARELHDVVAHSTLLVQVQASTARYRYPALPADAAAEFDEIAETAQASLVEMRRLLGVLRTEDHDPELSPQQGIEDIPALIDGVRRTGTEVRSHVGPLPDELPSSVQIAAFRITQEALSNAGLHAPGSVVDVEIDTQGDALRVRVRNGPGTGAPPRAAETGTGHGLRGMQERAAVFGGSLIAGPESGGGWAITAVLPWTGTRGASS